MDSRIYQNGFNPRTIPIKELVKEYSLIQEKKSMLSYSQRQLIILAYEEAERLAKELRKETENETAQA